MAFPRTGKETGHQARSRAGHRFGGRVRSLALAVTAIIGVAGVLGVTSDVAFAADTHSAITPGTALASAAAVQVSITTPGQKAYYTFTVTAADVSAKKVLTAQLTGVSGLSGHFEILGPGDTVFYDYGGIFNTTYTTAVVTTPGAYQVLIAPGTTTGSATLKLIEPVDVTGTVTPGTTLTSATPTGVTITDPGQKAYYSFSIAAADVAAKRRLTAQISGVSGLSGHFEILGPGGTVFYDYGGIFNTTYTTSVLTTPGTYKVLIAPGTTIGNATLKIVEPIDQSSGTVTPGTTFSTAIPTAVSITDPGQNASYSFSVSAADVAAKKLLTAQLSSVMGLGGHFEILDPTGGLFYDYGGIYNTTYTTAVLTTPGTYTVLLATGSTTGSATLKLIKPVDITGTVTPGTALTTATPTGVAITDPGQKAYYSFTVTAADVAAQNVLTGQISSDSGLSGHFEILGPGDTVFYDYGGIYNTTYTTGVLTTPGTYKVLIAAGTTTGTATLKLIKTTA